MSIVVAAYGASYIALGADHGQWKIAPDGTAHSPSIHSESKLRAVPGCPMVLASVGRSEAKERIDAFIQRKHYTPETYRIYDAAKELWGELFQWFDPVARASLAAAGFDAEHVIEEPLRRPDKDFPEVTQRVVAGLSFIACGVDLFGFTRFFMGEYPSPEITMVNLSANSLFPGFASGCMAMGSHDVLGGFGNMEVDYSKLGTSGAIDLCRFMLDTVDRAEGFRAATGGVRKVMPPYDVLLVRASGVEWIASPREEIAVNAR